MRWTIALLALAFLSFLSFSVNVTGCEAITANGTYNLISGLSGANISASPLPGSACIVISAANVTLNCSGFSIANNGTAGTTIGVLVNGSFNNVTIRNCPSISSYTYGIYMLGANRSRVNTTSVANNTYGIYLDNANNTNISNSTASGNTYGIALNGSTLGRITNFSVSNGTYGILVNSSSNITIANTTALNNSLSSVASLSSSHIIIGNSSYSSSAYGILLNSTSNSTVSNNTISQNTYGLYSESSNSTKLSTGRFFNSTVAELIFNNSGGSPMLVNLTRILIDSPSGTFANISNISLNDSLAASDAFLLKWSGEPSPLPGPYINFSNKFVNLTNLSPGVIIDRITLGWNSSEIIPPYDESRFALFKYNSSGWAKLNESPDETANSLSLSNVSAFSVFALAQNDGCPIINAPGSYMMTANFTGAFNPAPDGVFSVPPYFSCVYINSSDVDFDCAGYSIIGNNSFRVQGIVINNASNITVRNCNVVNHSIGYHVFESSVVNLYNNTALLNGSSFEGFRISGSSNNVTNNSVRFLDFGFGIRMAGNGNIVSGNLLNHTAVSSSTGITIFGNESTISNNLFLNASISDSGLGPETSNNTISGNNFTNGNIQIFNVLFDYLIHNNTILQGYIAISANSGVNITNNTISGSFVGITSQNTNQSIISGNRIFNTTTYGIQLSGVTRDNLIIGNIVNNTTLGGILVGLGNNTTVQGNNATSIETSFATFVNILNNIVQAETGAFGEGMISSFGGENITILNNTANDISGSVLAGTLTVANNTATNGSIFVNGAEMAIVENNTLFGGTSFGDRFELSGENISARFNRINGSEGFYISGLNVNLSDSIAGNLSGIGVEVTSFGSANINNVTAENASTGFVFGSSGTNASNINASLISGDAIQIFSGANDTKISNAYTSASNALTIDVNDDYVFNVSGLIVDSPAGGLQNFTNISVNDVGDIGSSGIQLIIRHADSAGNVAFPPGNKPFAKKLVNISQFGFGTNLIDSITWTWQDSELGVDDYESEFELWLYNDSGWQPLNTTPDTVNNELSLFGHIPGSTYVIMENGSVGVPNCPILAYPGKYFMDSNWVGAPNDFTSCVLFNTSDAELNCSGFNITNNGTPSSRGVYAENLRNVTLKNCLISGYTQSGIELFSVNDSLILNNTIRNISSAFFSGKGISTTLGLNNTIQGNLINNTNRSGILLASSNNTLLFNNTASFNGLYGFETYLSFNNSYINNTANNNLESGFILGFPPSDLEADNSTFIGNNVYNNTFEGFDIELASHNVFINNSVHHNFENGFHMDENSINNSFFNNTVYSNSLHGMSITNTTATFISGDRFYSNGISDITMQLSPSAMTINLSGVIFDGPGGILENYSNISMNDTVSASSSYRLKNSAQPSSPPSGSFRKKFLEITRLSGTVVIDNITWHWLDSELSGYDETQFELWKNNASGWTKINDAPDTGANTLSNTSISPLSVFGILQDGLATTLDNCPVISSSGTFNMTENFVGSPNSASPISGTACVKITSSNVTFDCKGFNITNNVAGTTNGIAIAGSLANVTIKNCVISNYTNGINLQSANRSNITNNTINTRIGIRLSGSGNNSVTGNNISTQGVPGGNSGIILLSASGDNNITRNNITTNGSANANTGVDISGLSHRNNVSSNNISTNGTFSNQGIIIQNSSNTTVFNNTLTTPTDAAIYLANNVLFTNVAGNNILLGANGIYMVASLAPVSNNTVENNTVNSSGTSGSNHGILSWLQAATTSMTNNRIANNTVNATNGTGIYAIGLNLSNISGNIVRTVGNAHCLVLQENSSRNNVTGNLLQSCGAGGIVVVTLSNNNQITNNTVDLAGVAALGDGFTQANSSNNTVSGNSVLNSSDDGFVVNTNSFNNTIHNNTARNVVAECFEGSVNSIQNNFTNNTADRCGTRGIILTSNASSSIVSGNRITNSNQAVHIISNSSNNLVRDNSAENFTFHAYQTQTSSNNNTFINNSVTNSTFDGFRMETANNTLINNTASMTRIGLHLDLGSSGTSVNGFTTSIHTMNGIQLGNSSANNLSNVTSSGSALAGIVISNTNNTLVNGAHFYNNSPDLRFTGTGITFNMTNIILDNPLGNFVNYTNLSINDTVSSEYNIDHSTEPITLPPGPSFAQKYVNITNITSGVSIDSITWHWLDSELSGYSEASFQLWKFNSSGWTILNSTPDVVGNKISSFGMGSFSVIGILNGSTTGTPAAISAAKADVTASSPSPGGIVQFNITITNIGGLDMTSVSVNDTLPAGLTFLSASPANTSGSGQDLSWTLGALPSFTSTSILLNATVGNVTNDTNRTVNLTNFVNVSGTPTNGSDVTSNTQTTVTIFHHNVSVSKVSTSQNVSPGGIVQFNITVNNTGNVTINATVNDTLPAGLTFLSASPPASLSGQSVVWNVTSLAPGAVQVLLLNATADPGIVSAGTPVINLTNFVNASAKPPNGNNASSNSSADATVYYANVSANKLDQTALSPSPGGIVQFNITITNTGNVTLNTVRVVDTIPAGLTFASSSPLLSSLLGSNVTWNNVGPLAPGASTVIYLNATVNPISPGLVFNVTNNVTVTGVPPSGANVTASSFANATIYSSNLSVVKTVISSGPYSPGGLVEYQISITNIGNVTLNTSVNDTLSPGLSFDAASIAPSAISPDNRSINWTIGPMAPGSSVTILLNASIGSVTPGTYNNSVTATGTPPNGNNATDSDSIGVGIGAAGISVAKTKTPGGNVLVGSTVNYTITATNTGSVTMNISVVDYLPPGMSFSSSNVTPDDVAGDNTTGTNITWNFTSVGPGASRIISFNATVDSAGSFTNNVSALGIPDNGAPVNDSDSDGFNGATTLSAPSDDGDEEDEERLDIEAIATCDAGYIRVSSEGSPISGAHVTVSIPNGGSVFVGDTDSSGIVSGTFLATIHSIHASKSGYLSAIQLLEVGKLSCLETSECTSNSDCPILERCYNPDVGGMRLGPLSTYSLAPNFAQCIDQQIADEVDEEDFYCSDSSIPSDITLEGLDSGQVNFVDTIAVGPEACIEDPGDVFALDFSYCSICSSKCTHESDCRAGHCIHLNLSFDQVLIGGGSCGYESSNPVCYGTSACSDKNQVCIKPPILAGTDPATVAGTCRITTCTGDSQCPSGSYCEDAYGKCVHGCNQGHTSNCGVGYFCDTGEPASTTRPLATINSCIPGCLSDNGCGIYEFCNLTSSPGTCQPIGCGDIDKNNHDYTGDPQYPNSTATRGHDQWECDPRPRGSDTLPNRACRVCLNSEKCLLSSDTYICNHPSCLADTDCVGRICNQTTGTCQALSACSQDRPVSATSCPIPLSTDPPDCSCPLGKGCVDGVCSIVMGCLSDSNCTNGKTCVPLGDQKRCATCDVDMSRPSAGQYTAINITVTCDGNPCPLCEVQITDPSGTATPVRTSADGSTIYTPTNGSGTYTATVGSTDHSATSTTDFGADPALPGCLSFIVLLVLGAISVIAFSNKST
jgi:uncharacterized repeat protein (TIGR01451 family)